jgi:hypothetical protein
VLSILFCLCVFCGLCPFVLVLLNCPFLVVPTISSKDYISDIFG